MALGSKMYYAVYSVFLHGFKNLLVIHHVSLHKDIVLAALYVLEIGKVAGICEFIVIDYLGPGILLYEHPYHMGAYEPSSTGYHYCFHIVDLILFPNYESCGARSVFRQILSDSLQ